MNLKTRNEMLAPTTKITLIIINQPIGCMIWMILLWFVVGCSSPLNSQRDTQLESLVAARGVVLEGEIGHRLFSQCSRSAPKPDGFWSPSSEHIAALESEFPHYIQKVFARHRASLPKYHRQYAGFTRKGRNLIYCNFLTLEPSTHRPLEYLENVLRTRSIIICDGGDEFFGVVYDVEKHAFSDYRANGVF